MDLVHRVVSTAGISKSRCLTIVVYVMGCTFIAMEEATAASSERRSHDRVTHICYVYEDQSHPPRWATLIIFSHQQGRCRTQDGPTPLEG